MAERKKTSKNEDTKMKNRQKMSTTKKESSEKARPSKQKPDRVAQRDKQRHPTGEEQEKQQRTVRRTETQSNREQLKCEKSRPKPSPRKVGIKDGGTKYSGKGKDTTETKKDLNKTPRSLPDVQKQPVLAEQVTPATSQRTPQEPDNSKEQQQELASNQPRTWTGLSRF